MSHTTQEGVLAAIRRFPAKRREIEALARERESFGDICDELAAAEQALAGVDRLDEATRAERRLEWLSFIRETLAEIEAELRRANVVPLDRGGHRQP
jgi:hypothetical protein